MVGWAMNMSAGQNVPAHRVVNSAGILTGKNHFEDPLAMQTALESEGIQVKDDQVQDFQRCFWDPAIELSID